ncbi:MAG: DUF4359 domain-containing protein [Cylindrospermopsis raciborskii KL1]|jgi:hypothetical protein|nr:DUF4359 domain-containing protein [Cylindrospermopsis raciborskii KL1]
MKFSVIITSLSVLAIAGLGVTMAHTNPREVTYQEYAVKKITTVLKTDGCQKVPIFLRNLVRFDCNQLVDSAKSQIRDVVVATTKRQNYVLLSLYITNLKIHDSLPGYTFETLGVFNSFYTYRVKQE